MSPTRFALVGFVMWLPSCSSDPVRAHLLDSLGGETPGVPAGPLHRPGQPCAACHDAEGPAATVFSLAGTVYQDAMTLKPLPDARVHFIDANGKTYDTGVNCAGNFFVMNADYHPDFPVWVTLFYGMNNGQPISVQMESPIYREASCAICHQDPPSTDTVAHVYLSPVAFPAPPSPSCP